MNIQQLRYFDAVCTYGSLSKAAQNLFISQQGLSMSIQRLETEFSCRLLTRSPKGICPTEAGTFFWEHAKIILREADLCEEYFANAHPVAYNIKVASSYGALSEFAARTIHAFEQENPQIHLNVTEYVDDFCDESVYTEESDLGLSIGPIDETKFDAIPLFTRRLCLVVNKDNPLANQKVIHTEDLDKLPMVTVNSHFKSEQVFMSVCRSCGVKPDVRVQVGEVVSVHRLVATLPEMAGLSVESVAKDIITPNVVAVPLENVNFNWAVYLVKKKDSALMPAAQHFSDYMQRNYHLDPTERIG